MMIGKIQDVLSAAVVISAADNAQGISSQGNSGQEQNQNQVQADNAAGGLQSSNALATPSTQTDAKNKDNSKQNKDKMDEKTVSNMTKELNELMDKINCDLEFQYHKEVNVMSVKMVDKQTKEVLREYPPEDMIKGMIKAREWIGAFLDKNA